MQKRTLYLSLLLVTCLLFIGSSIASAQEVKFQSKTVQRCSDVVVNITVTSPEQVSAFEIVFEATGDYSSMSVDFADGFTALGGRFEPTFYGNIVRMAAYKEDGDCACLDAAAGVVVGEITFHTKDICSGAINIVGASIEGLGSCETITATTALVSCDLEALTTNVVNGTVTIANQLPTIVCPGDTTVHFNTFLNLPVTIDDLDLGTDCETLILSVKSGPGSIVGGNYQWTPPGDSVCVNTITLEVVDDCGATAECSFDICVYNDPPVITHDPADTIFTVWGILLGGAVDAEDLDGGPHGLLYTVVSFDGPTSHGSGLQINPSTGAWTWDIGYTEAYAGNFTLCLKASDGANVCDPCSPENADTACYAIRVTGFAISLQKVHHQLQGHNTTVSIYLDSGWVSPLDPIGGFDFLIAYDVSALSATSVLPGALIDDGKFEYFTYRFGAYGNCGNGCPSGLLRIVSLRETNNGVVNTYHTSGPGELAKINFYVSNNRIFECQKVPISFFWIDCGDNTLSDETGNWLYLGLKVFDFEGNEITDPVSYGYNGPAADCYDTVYNGQQEFKNAPLGAVTFRNGGIDIECADSIDARGDINLNGISNEIADAVVFTNYFIEGLLAFTINVDGQVAATEVNGDGYTLTVADLVYLIRIIVGDAQPLPKQNPNAFANFAVRGDIVSVESNVDIGAALFVFDGRVTPTLATNASHMRMIYGYQGMTTRTLVYSLDGGRAITSGDVLNVSGEANLISVEAAEYRGATLKTSNKILPTEFVLNQNYPNPFNPVTTINLALPVASDWSLSIFNVQGQKVAQFSGTSEPGIVSVNWDASGLGSGLYFYKAQAGTFSATKKMVLLK